MKQFKDKLNNIFERTMETNPITRKKLANIYRDWRKTSKKQMGIATSPEHMSTNVADIGEADKKYTGRYYRVTLKSGQIWGVKAKGRTMDQVRDEFEKEGVPIRKIEPSRLLYPEEIEVLEQSIGSEITSFEIAVQALNNAADEFSQMANSVESEEDIQDLDEDMINDIISDLQGVVRYIEKSRPKYTGSTNTFGGDTGIDADYKG
jgi:hypothetical protein